MTDERKPETPGMAEVSPKIVDEAEAVVEAAATQKARDAIEAVLDKLPPQGEDETQIENVYRKVLALREYGPPRDSTEQDVAAWIDSHDGLEEEIGTLRAEKLHDVEIKMAVTCDRIKLNLGPGEQPDSADLIIAQSARDDLRRIAGGSGVAKVPQSDTALAALWEEWQRLWEANKKAVEEAEDDKLANETFTALMAVEKSMEDMPACTAAGIWNKLQVAGVWIDTNRGSPDEDKMGVVERLTLSALADLEHLAGKASMIDEPLLALERRWREAEKALEEEKTDWRPVAKVQDEIIATPARSIAGILVKLRVYGDLAQENAGVPKIDQMPLSELGDAQAAVVSAIRDLERMAANAASPPQRSPIFSQVFAIETPLVDAEGAVRALWLLVEDGKLALIAEPIAYLVSHLSGHIKEQRRLFDELFVAAGGSTA